MKTALFIFLLFTGCASFEQPFKAEFDRGPDVRIQYQYVNNGYEMDTLCPKREGVVLGCAFIPPTADGVCVVILFHGDTETKDHEDKHCRYGRWHS